MNGTRRHFARATVVAALAVALLACSDPGTRLSECAEGETKCHDTQSQMTCVDGRWSAPRKCEDQTCATGACAGECAPGQSRCVGRGPERCGDDGTWRFQGVCEECVMVDGAATCQDCTEGQTRCEDAQHVRSCTNGRWDTPQPCEDQTCLVDQCAGECAQGDARCSPGENAVDTCGVEGMWTKHEMCEGNAWQWDVCRDAACVDSPFVDVGHVLADRPGWDDAPMTANRWYVSPFTVSEPVRVFRLAAFITDIPGGAVVRMALWRNVSGANGDQPGELVEDTVGVTPMPGWNEFELDYNSDPAVLEPGPTYWVGVVTGHATDAGPYLHSRNSGGPSVVFDGAWEAADPFPAVTPTPEVEYGFYLKVKTLR